MIQVSAAELQALLAGFFWPLARILALMVTAPVLNSPVIPVRVKVGLGVALAALVAPLSGEAPAVAPFSGAGFALLVEQLLVGAALGFAMRLVFVAVDVAGELAGLQMGLGFASFFDPQNAASTPLVAQFLNLFATLVFLALDGHLLLLSALVESFRTLPVGLPAPGGGILRALLEWSAVIFRGGLALALPVIAALLVVNIALGILNRVSPQLSLFSVGFPLTLLAGLFALSATLPHVAPSFEALVRDAHRLMLSLPAR